MPTENNITSSVGRRGRADESYIGDERYFIFRRLERGRCKKLYFLSTDNEGEVN
jgi:hypothetical protein